MLESLWQDVRYALRSIRRSAAFSLVVITTIALAIGANAALFSIFNGLVLTTLPIGEPARLVVLTALDERGASPQFIYETTLQSLRDGQQVFDHTSLYSGGGVLRTEGRGMAIDAGVEGVDPDYFDMVSARAVLGRVLAPADTIGTSGAPVVVVSHRLWQRLFAGDPHAIGERVIVEGTPLTIIGVLDAAFHGLQRDAGADLFMTMPAVRAISGDPSRPLRARNVIARLRPTVSLETARAHVVARWPAARAVDVPGLSAADQRLLRSQRLEVESIATGFSFLRQQYGDPVAILVGLTALLLAIGCANLGGLLLGRATARHRQFAVRLALGASRTRLGQQALVEALTFAALGMIAAIPMAWWTSRLVGNMLLSGSTLRATISMTPDVRVLAMSGLVTMATGLLVGVFPAYHASRTRTTPLVDAMCVAAPTQTLGRILLVGQIALSLVLLVVAVLFARSMRRLVTSQEPYEPSHVAWARLWMKPGERAATFDVGYWRELADRLGALPGVESVAYSFLFPAAFNSNATGERFAVADGAARDKADGFADAISPGFFRTVGVPLIDGRDLTWKDDAQALPVGIITTALASRLFPVGRAIGRHIRLRPLRIDGREPSRPIEIVGVVADARFGNLREPSPSVLFRPMLQEPARARVPVALVRAHGDATPVRDAYRATVERSRHFVRNVYRLDEYVDEVLLRERLLMWLSTFFAAFAVLLSCIGLYGLLAYSVARRTREIGIRMALGATPRAMLHAIAREGLVLGAVGVAAGVPCALVAGRFVRSMLYGLAPTDPATISGAAAVFITLAVLSGLTPAYRASAVDPIAALRHD